MMGPTIQNQRDCSYPFAKHVSDNSRNKNHTLNPSPPSFKGNKFNDNDIIITEAPDMPIKCVYPSPNPSSTTKDSPKNRNSHYNSSVPMKEMETNKDYFVKSDKDSEIGNNDTYHYSHYPPYRNQPAGHYKYNEYDYNYPSHSSYPYPECSYPSCDEHHDRYLNANPSSVAPSSNSPPPPIHYHHSSRHHHHAPPPPPPHSSRNHASSRQSTSPILSSHPHHVPHHIAHPSYSVPSYSQASNVKHHHHHRQHIHHRHHNQHYQHQNQYNSNENDKLNIEEIDDKINNNIVKDRKSSCSSVSSAASESSSSSFNHSSVSHNNNMKDSKDNTGKKCNSKKNSNVNNNESTKRKRDTNGNSIESDMDDKVNIKINMNKKQIIDNDASDIDNRSEIELNSDKERDKDAKNVIIPLPGPVVEVLDDGRVIKRRRTRRKLCMGKEEWENQRKASHKEVERRRRDAINFGIQDLSRLIPNAQLQKGKLLQQTVAYIQDLKETQILLIKQFNDSLNQIKDAVMHVESFKELDNSDKETLIKKLNDIHSINPKEIKYTGNTDEFDNMNSLYGTLYNHTSMGPVFTGGVASGNQPPEIPNILSKTISNSSISDNNLSITKNDED